MISAFYLGMVDKVIPFVSCFIYLFIYFIDLIEYNLCLIQICDDLYNSFNKWIVFLVNLHNTTQIDLFNNYIDWSNYIFNLFNSSKIWFLISHN